MPSFGWSRWSGCLGLSTCGLGSATRVDNLLGTTFAATHYFLTFNVSSSYSFKGITLSAFGIDLLGNLCFHFIARRTCEYGHCSDCCKESSHQNYFFHVVPLLRFVFQHLFFASGMTILLTFPVSTESYSICHAGR